MKNSKCREKCFIKSRLSNPNAITQLFLNSCAEKKEIHVSVRSVICKISDRIINTKNSKMCLSVCMFVCLSVTRHTPNEVGPSASRLLQI